MSLVPEYLVDRNFPIRAVDAIRDILDYGATKHAPGAWRTEDFEHHLEKVVGHLRKYLDNLGETVDPHGEDNLECALTRLAMAVDIRREKHGR